MRKNKTDLNLLKELYVNRKLSASDCAKILGVSKNTCLYHLRKMDVIRKEYFRRDEYGRFIREGQELPPKEGPNSYNWKEGKSIYRKIAFDFYKKHECFHCKNNEVDKLDVHHLDHDRENNHPSNLRIVCRPCHFKVYHPYILNKKRDKKGRFIKDKK